MRLLIPDVNPHDARALALIDRALAAGSLTADLVEQIRRALDAARRADAIRSRAA